MNSIDNLYYNKTEQEKGYKSNHSLDRFTSCKNMRRCRKNVIDMIKLSTATGLRVTGNLMIHLYEIQKFNERTICIHGLDENMRK